LNRLSVGEGGQAPVVPSSSVPSTIDGNLPTLRIVHRRASPCENILLQTQQSSISNVLEP